MKKKEFISNLLDLLEEFEPHFEDPLELGPPPWGMTRETRDKFLRAAKKVLQEVWLCTKCQAPAVAFAVGKNCEEASLCLACMAEVVKARLDRSLPAS